MITSKDNNLVKHINKLKHKKDRKIYLEYIIEGEKIVKEAINTQQNNIVNIFVSESYAKSNNIESDYNILIDEVFEYVTEHQTPEGILAIMKINENDIRLDFTEKYIIILDEVQDPGNLGNIIRIADSLGLKQIILSENTVDPYMPKVVRSTMGSIFRVNVFEKSINNVIKELEENNYEIFSAVLDKDSKSLYELESKNKKIAVIFGNESRGVSNDVLNITKKLYIPMLGEAESLNVASSVAIISYEIFRQNI